MARLLYQNLLDARRRQQCTVSNDGSVERNFPPSEQSNAVVRDSVFDQRFAERVGIVIGWHKEHSNTKVIFCFEFRCQTRHLLTKEIDGQLCEDSGTIPRLRVCRDCSPMSQIADGKNRLADDVVTLFTGNLRHEPCPARIVLEPGVVQRKRIRYVPRI
jgi:hypothetical protein